VTFPTATGRIRRLHWQQDGALPHFHREVRRFFNKHLPRHRNGHSIQNIDLLLEEWPPRSPDIIPCDVFLWGYLKDLVFLPLLHRNLKEMKESILAARSTIDGDMILRVREGLQY
jgi:hypothetical protein